MTKSSTILHYIYFVDYTMPESGSANVLLLLRDNQQVRISWYRVVFFGG